jgi:hypothetical protein
MIYKKCLISSTSSATVCCAIFTVRKQIPPNNWSFSEGGDHYLAGAFATTTILNVEVETFSSPYIRSTELISF